MQSFEYANPATLQEAVALLSPQWGHADVLAGGTDLISLMKDHLHTPRRVVNIKNIKELGGISKTAEGIRIGAIVTIDELAKSSEVPKSLAEAAAGIPSPQIRHMGTVGGDLCQRPRCWYYRQGMGLLAMQDGKSRIPDGENRYHSIFGEGPAYFVSASSLGPALIALNAKVKLVSAKGTRELAVSRFFVTPKDENTREIESTVRRGRAFVRIGVIPFSRIGPSVTLQPSVRMRVCSSDQMRSSDQVSALSSGAHWR